MNDLVSREKIEKLQRDIAEHAMGGYYLVEDSDIIGAINLIRPESRFTSIWRVPMARWYLFQYNHELQVVRYEELETELARQKQDRENAINPAKTTWRKPSFAQGCSLLVYAILVPTYFILTLHSMITDQPWWALWDFVMMMLMVALLVGFGARWLRKPKA